MIFPFSLEEVNKYGHAASAIERVLAEKNIFSGKKNAASRIHSRLANKGQIAYTTPDYPDPDHPEGDPRPNLSIVLSSSVCPREAKRWMKWRDLAVGEMLIGFSARENKQLLARTSPGKIGAFPSATSEFEAMENQHHPAKEATTSVALL